MGLTTTLLKVGKQSWNMSNLRWGPGSRDMRNISLFMLGVPSITGSSLLHANAVPVRTWEEWGKVSVLILIQRGFPSSTRFGAVRCPPTTTHPSCRQFLDPWQWPKDTWDTKVCAGQEAPKDLNSQSRGWPGDSELHDRQWSSQLVSFLEVSEQGQLLRRVDIGVLRPPVTSVPSLRLRKGIGCPCNNRH